MVNFLSAKKELRYIKADDTIRQGTLSENIIRFADKIIHSKKQRTYFFISFFKLVLCINIYSAVMHTADKKVSAAILYANKFSLIPAKKDTEWIKIIKAAKTKESSK